MTPNIFKDFLLRNLAEDLKTNRAPDSLYNEVANAVLGRILIKNLWRQDADETEDTDFLRKIIINSNNQDVRDTLKKAEEKIGRALNTSVDNDGDDKNEDENEDEIENNDSQFPNLKYRKPKYQNLESVLKYVESKEKKGDNGGDVRIVIMNFND